jgi:hypothetical protein
MTRAVVANRRFLGKQGIVRLKTGARAAVERLKPAGEREAVTRGRRNYILRFELCRVKRTARSSFSLPI